MLKTIRLSVLATVSLSILMPTVGALAQEEFFGSGIPLKMAVRQIAPKDVEVVYGDGVDGSKLASWGGPDDGSWKKAAASAAKSAGYVAIVSDSKVTVTTVGGVVDAPVKTVEKVEVTKTQKVEVAKVDRPVRKIETAPARERVEVEPVEPKPRVSRVKPAERRERVERHEPRREAKASRPVEVETVSGGGFVFIPEERRPVVAAAPVDAKGDAGWRRYGKGDRPRVASIAPSPAPALPAPWTVSEGDDLYAVLSRWSQQAGWTLVWKSEHIYSLNSSAQFKGNFVDVVTQLLAALRDVKPIVNARFYSANQTIVVGNDLGDSVN